METFCTLYRVLLVHMLTPLLSPGEWGVEEWWGGFEAEEVRRRTRKKSSAWWEERFTLLVQFRGFEIWIVAGIDRLATGF